MITNEERKQVAARLRNYENLRESFRESPICAFLDALGVGYLDWKGVCDRLADLIEPEPERVLTLTPGEIYPECNKMVGIHESCCCKCGAEVINNAD